MKKAVCLLVLMLAVTATYGSPRIPINEDDHGDATAPYWKGKLGWILEQIGKFLRQSSESSPALYTAEDAATQSEDATVEQIGKVTKRLNKVADTIEKGEKVNLFH
ncbi:uncharacterized protein [Dermacentor andersoni]|uniref:uncharacterized protein n=1 Tax=Dermacentor andersoni TaxID=34620 RepID=UPI0024163BB7|nr:uncharacterized protein LOC129387425 [Dermacentor andersoni]